MGFKKAIQESDIGCASGEGEIWKTEGNDFQVLDLNANESHFISSERALEMDRMRDSRGITFTPMKGK